MQTRMAGIDDLPIEILLRIFQFYLNDKNQRNLMNIVSRVCKMWKTACQSSILWRKFDGTIPHETMMELCLGGSLDFTKELTLIKCLNNEDAEKFFSRLKKVEVIKLLNAEGSSKNVISIIAQSNLNLKEIHIENNKLPTQPLNLKPSILETIFSLNGRNLTTIKISYCKVSNLSQVLKCLSENCQHLEHFNFTNNSTHGVFPTEYFQLNCPRLRILHLDHNICINRRKHTLGFPNLEVFSYNDLSPIPHINDNDIESLLFNSPNLKFLSLINCSVSVEILCSLPATAVEYLFLSRSKTANSDNLPDLFKKWCYSLKQVDISYSRNMSVNNAVLILTALPIQPTIEFLDLSYTKVTSDTVKRILEKCGEIQMLHLNACRNLSRGLKKSYSGKTELRILFEKIQASAYNESTDDDDEKMIN